MFGSLARTASNVIGSRKCSSDVVDDELAKGHHHGGQLVISNVDVRKEDCRKYTGVWQFSAVVGYFRRADAVCIVGWQKASVTGKRFAPGFHSGKKIKNILKHLVQP